MAPPPNIPPRIPSASSAFSPFLLVPSPASESKEEASSIPLMALNAINNPSASNASASPLNSKKYRSLSSSPASPRKKEESKDPGWKMWTVYQATLQINRMNPTYDWWNHIVTIGKSSIYLGALPLKHHSIMSNENDAKKLVEECNIKAVVSAVQHFENHSEGPLSSAVTKEDWEKLNVSHLQVPVDDFDAVNPKKLDMVIAFIERHIKAGENVYVHCKAGKGRSVLIVLCLLIHNQHMSALSALELIKNKRKQINLSRTQWNAVVAYEKYVKESVSDKKKS